MKYKFLFIFPIVALVVFLTLYGSTANGINKSEETNYQTPLRLIGHKLLLSSGDSKSRVMPIKQLPGDELEIYFENELSLEPDSVFNIISKTIKSSKLPNDYTANVLECYGNEIVYSFVMSGNDKNVIVPCLGRTLPKGCYYISINFSPESGSKRNYILSGCILLLILLAYLMNLYFRRKSNTIRENESTPVRETIKIGEFLFCFDQRYLEIYGERIELTDKESKLLYIFALTPNEIIDREQLQKEVWENEGVIVTRSLDVFISKLRKKLEKDSGVKLVNVHGKGYKLEIPRS
jgi:DNA-binding winged helix-turn-helix (wHTH) protein